MKAVGAGGVDWFEDVTNLGLLAEVKLAVTIRAETDDVGIDVERDLEFLLPRKGDEMMPLKIGLVIPPRNECLVLRIDLAEILVRQQHLLDNNPIAIPMILLLLWK